jgi:hypothetical protein
VSKPPSGTGSEPEPLFGIAARLLPEGVHLIDAKEFPGAAAAIAAAGKAIGQAAAKANGEIDQVNADVTQAYSIANGMATGSCAGDGPGRPPVPIGHIPSN